MIEITNEDNMVLMARYPDKYFDLAIVDPPYGIGADVAKNGSKGQRDYYNKQTWDIKPNDDYYKELFRVSKNQIIWGANHLGNLPSSPCWIVWDKENGENSYADCELAWTSFKSAVRMCKIKWHGMLQHDMKDKQKRIHPTEKPYKLYKYILNNYAKEGDKILDTHLGSGSIAIACHDYGFDLTACELDKDYFDAAMKRLKQHQSQTKLF